MKRLVALLLVFALAAVSGVAAGVCGSALTARSHCCCHPDSTGDAVANPCQCRMAPQPTSGPDSLPPSASAPDRIDHGALPLMASAALSHVAAHVATPGPVAPGPPGSPPSYLLTHSFRC